MPSRSEMNQDSEDELTPAQKVSREKLLKNDNEVDHAPILHYFKDAVYEGDDVSFYTWLAHWIRST